MGGTWEQQTRNFHHYISMALLVGALSLQGLILAPVPAVARVNVARSGQTAMADLDDVMGNPFYKAINALQEAIQTSPAAKFKKGLAKLQVASSWLLSSSRDIDASCCSVSLATIPHPTRQLVQKCWLQVACALGLAGRFARCRDSRRTRHKLNVVPSPYTIHPHCTGWLLR